MKIKRIFTKKHPCKLWAVRYPNDVKKDVFDKLFDQWTDTQFLRDFFIANAEKLQTEFWEYKSIDEAIDQVLDEAGDFEEELRAIELGLPGCRKIGEVFEHLQMGEYQLRSRNEGQRKARPYFRKPMIRIYALEFDGCYIITGGLLKLTEKMEDKEEIEKIEKLKTYLKSEGILTNEGLDED